MLGGCEDGCGAPPTCAEPPARCAPFAQGTQGARAKIPRPARVLTSLISQTPNLFYSRLAFLRTRIPSRCHDGGFRRKTSRLAKKRNSREEVSSAVSRGLVNFVELILAAHRLGQIIKVRRLAIDKTDAGFGLKFSTLPTITIQITGRFTRCLPSRVPA